jgi:deoxyribose-phosphate aldolase
VDPSRARSAISLIDLTDLNDDSTDAAVAALCARAVEHGTAAVCVWPDFVGRARREVAGSVVRVATVVNFPSGGERAHSVGVLTAQALGDGADEIDVVLPFRAFAAGDDHAAATMLDVVRSSCGPDRVMKVILETGELVDPDTIDRAARFAIVHGADFIKTSSGKTPISATPAAVEVMLRAIADAERPVGLKPSGGIRTAAEADRYLMLAEQTMGAGWPTPDTFRFGASGLLDALVAELGGPSSPSTRDDTY